MLLNLITKSSFCVFKAKFKFVELFSFIFIFLFFDEISSMKKKSKKKFNEERGSRRIFEHFSVRNLVVCRLKE